MRIKTVRIALLFHLAFLFAVPEAKAVLSERRRFQLDSITTNIPAGIRRDLNNVHRYLDSLGQGEEEKVWMFYGYIGTWFRYDDKRKNDFGAKEYSPEYTTQRSNGVCRDFAKVFAALCAKSNIVCLEVHGKTPQSFMDAFNRWIHRISNVTTHVWNVVRIDGEWQLMDPTWTYVETTEKIRTWIPKKKTCQVTLVKSVSRKYYNPAPEMMAIDHTPVHPAFFLSPTVWTYKTARKKEKNREPYAENYPFKARLDSIAACKYPAYSKILYKEADRYSRCSMIGVQYNYELGLPFLKASRSSPPTIEGYDRYAAHMKELTLYLKDSLKIDYSLRLRTFEAEIETAKTKLAKKQKAQRRR